VHELAVLGQDRWVEIERVHGHRRAGYPLDGRSMLLIDMPQRMTDHFVGDRVELASPFAMQLQLGRTGELRGRDIPRFLAVEDRVVHFAYLHKIGASSITSRNLLFLT